MIQYRVKRYSNPLVQGIKKKANTIVSSSGSIITPLKTKLGTIFRKPTVIAPKVQGSTKVSSLMSDLKKRNNELQTIINGNQTSQIPMSSSIPNRLQDISSRVKPVSTQTLSKAEQGYFGIDHDSEKLISDQIEWLKKRRNGMKIKRLRTAA